MELSVRPTRQGQACLLAVPWLWICWTAFFLVCLERPVYGKFLCASTSTIWCCTPLVLKHCGSTLLFAFKEVRQAMSDAGMVLNAKKTKLSRCQWQGGPPVGEALLARPELTFTRAHCT
eukprot:1546231-Amphidinium_carterae.3